MLFGGSTKGTFPTQALRGLLLGQSLCVALSVLHVLKEKCLLPFCGLCLLPAQLSCCSLPGHGLPRYWLVSSAPCVACTDGRVCLGTEVLHVPMSSAMEHVSEEAELALCSEGLGMAKLCRARVGPPGKAVGPR